MLPYSIKLLLTKDKETGITRQHFLPVIHNKIIQNATHEDFLFFFFFYLKQNFNLLEKKKRKA